MEKITYFTQAEKSGSGFYPIIKHYAVAHSQDGKFIASTGLCATKAGAQNSIFNKLFKLTGGAA